MDDIFKEKGGKQQDLYVVTAHAQDRIESMLGEDDAINDIRFHVTRATAFMKTAREADDGRLRGKTPVEWLMDCCLDAAAAGIVKVLDHPTLESKIIVREDATENTRRAIEEKTDHTQTVVEEFIGDRGIKSELKEEYVDPLINCVVKGAAGDLVTLLRDNWGGGIGILTELARKQPIEQESKSEIKGIDLK